MNIKIKSKMFIEMSYQGTSWRNQAFARLVSPSLSVSFTRRIVPWYFRVAAEFQETPIPRKGKKPMEEKEPYLFGEIF